MNKEKIKKTQGKNCEMKENTWDNLDTWERRDHELIRDHLNDALVKIWRMIAES